MMIYPEVINYLDAFINYERNTNYPYKDSLKLERIKDFLDTIGNPQAGLKCIHVAGTKGKGSTCAFIAYILKEAGFKVGLYTSPHLSDFRERIRILDHRLSTIDHRLSDFEGMISQEEIADLVKRLKPAIDDYNTKSEYGPLTFFEVYTALACVYFKEKQVDFAVLETGLGGRLDATNVVDALVSVITPISYEHTDKLGSTIREIAGEKAGIIKAKSAKRKAQNPIIISAPQIDEAMAVIKNKGKEVGARLVEISNSECYETELLGKHQQINAAAAAAAIGALRSYDISISNSQIREGIKNTKWPGRCEVISRNPLIVLDGAQNVASAQALKETIKECFRDKRLILVLGISSDKDIQGICRELSEIADEIILTKANSPRATEPKIIQSTMSYEPSAISLTATVKEAIELARSKAASEDLILFTGSLFVVGEAREIIVKIKVKVEV